MLTLTLNILVLLVFTASAYAHDAVVVQSLNVKPYEDLYQAFRSAYSGSVTRFVLSAGAIDVQKMIREERPKVIVAVGTEALLQVRKISKVPIVYAMVFNPGPLVEKTKISGIGMAIPPDRQLSLFRKLVPDCRKIGIIYDPSNSGNFVKKAVAAARASDIDLVTREVSSVKDVPKALASLKGAVDALWLLPDQTVLASETAEHMLLFGIDNKLPVLAFSSKYLKMGAVFSVDLDPSDIGRQAADFVRRAVSGDESGQQVPPRSAVPHINLKVAKKLGLAVDEDSLRKLGTVRFQ